MDTETLERARELRSQGLSWRSLSKATQIPMSTLRRHLSPRFAEQSRVAARAYKQRRKGVCVDCGAETGLRKTGDRTHDRCSACAPTHSRRFDHAEIIRLRVEERLSQPEIARRVGCVQGEVSYVLALNGLSVGRGCGPGRGPKLS